MTSPCGAGIGRDDTVLVDLQPRDKDRENALLEVDEGQLLTARRRHVLDGRRVVERIALAAAAGEDERNERCRESGFCRSDQRPRRIQFHGVQPELIHAAIALYPALPAGSTALDCVTAPAGCGTVDGLCSSGLDAAIHALE